MPRRALGKARWAPQTGPVRQLQTPVQVFADEEPAPRRRLVAVSRALAQMSVAAGKTASEVVVAKKRKLCKLYKAYNPGAKQRIKTGHKAWDSYLFAASNPGSAQPYGRCIDELTVDPKARVLWEGSRAFPRRRGWKRGQSMLDWAASVAEKAQADGYDIVHFERQSDIGSVVLNPSVIQKRSVWKCD